MPLHHNQFVKDWVSWMCGPPKSGLSYTARIQFRLDFGGSKPYNVFVSGDHTFSSGTLHEALEYLVRKGIKITPRNVRMSVPGNPGYIVSLAELNIRCPSPKEALANMSAMVDLYARDRAPLRMEWAGGRVVTTEVPSYLEDSSRRMKGGYRPGFTHASE